MSSINSTAAPSNQTQDSLLSEREATFEANLYYRLRILGYTSVNALAPVLGLSKQSLYKRLARGAEGSAWWESVLVLPSGALTAAVPGAELAEIPAEWPPVNIGQE